MAKNRWILLVILMIPLALSGCWNYREIEQMSIVGGMGVDMDPKDDVYQLTIELVNIRGGQEIQPRSKVITLSRETVFQSVRAAIALSGRKLYWSHAKVIIISEDLARSGMGKIVDWYVRDAETRPDVYLIVTRGASAKEIIQTAQVTNEILSFRLSDMIDNERDLATSASEEAWEFINEMGGQGIHPLLPVIELTKPDGVAVPRVQGSAIFKMDRLLGFLNGEETKSTLFIKDKIEGGLLTETLAVQDEPVRVTLEIFESQTSLNPGFSGDLPTMEISVKVNVGIGEIMGTADVISEQGRNLLKEQAESNLEKRLEGVIQKVQKEFGSDIFGFGNTIYKNHPRDWQRFKDDWDNIFPHIQVSVTCDMIIEGSALLAKPLPKSE